MARLRPATAADFEQLLGETLPFRVRASAVDHNGELMGVGGLGFLPNGTVSAFVIRRPGSDRLKVTFHKAGLWTMKEARRLGVRKVVAFADPAVERAEAWLERLGFVETLSEGNKVYVWHG